MIFLDTGFLFALFVEGDVHHGRVRKRSRWTRTPRIVSWRDLGREETPGRDLDLLVRGYKRIAVKVVDVCGNESTVVREI